MNKKLWINLFFKVAVVFVLFVFVLTIANSTLLVRYFTAKETNLLAEKTNEISLMDTDDDDTLSDAVYTLCEKYNFDIEIYDVSGKVICTTRSSQMMDFFNSGLEHRGFNMNHEKMEVLTSDERADGTVIETAVSRLTGDEYLVCHKQSGNVITEIRIQTAILENSASVAGEFVIVIAVFCLVAALLWIFFFARKFSAPISEMSTITESMSKLDFSRKVNIKSKDEIGQLGQSINNMSDKLDAALKELRKNNMHLQNEIEAERQLDIMRRGFVANVSHELKTPLAIISGYAEGLKLNVNNASKEAYCNTIIDETDKMNRLVLSILELSKYESAQAPTKPEIFDISTLASDILLRSSVSRSDLQAICDIPSGTLVFADVIQTEQILKSYIENAVAHTKQNGEIRIFSNTEESGKIKIFVKNTGEPVNPEIMPQIWQSFFRGNTAHSRDENRFGLGLSIVSAIIKAQEQSCGVFNTDDGVCFWFTCNLPPSCGSL